MPLRPGLFNRTTNRTEATMPKPDHRKTMEGQKDALAVTRIKEASRTLADDVEHLRSTIVRLENDVEDAELAKGVALAQVHAKHEAEVERLKDRIAAADADAREALTAQRIAHDKELTALNELNAELRTQLTVMTLERNRLETMRQEVFKISVEK